jgi:hypothetical protein
MVRKKYLYSHWARSVRKFYQRLAAIRFGL